METNRRFLLAAIFGFAITFTLSCSSDDDGGATIACKFKSTYKGKSFEFCQEISGEKASKHKDTFKEDCEDEGGTYYDSCSRDYDLTYKEEDGYPYFIYGKDVFNNCDEFIVW